MSKTQRDFYFDNAKFLLIFLVFIGHFIEPLMDEDTLTKTIFLLIYSFHMPAFIIISGYFSRGMEGFSSTLKLILKKLLLPYIVFQLLYSIFDSLLISANGIVINLITPYWLMWFVLSLIFWRLLISVIRLPGKLFLLIAFLLALISGYIDQIAYPLSLSRTIVFFPFFLIGYFLEKGDFNKVNNLLALKYKYMISFLVFTLTAIFFHYGPEIQREWFFGSFSYSKLGHLEWFASLYRLLFFLIAIINSLLFFWLIPEGKRFFSEMGGRTIYPYLLHGFFVKILIVSGIYSQIDSLIEYIFLIVFIVISLFIMSSKLIQNIFKPLVELDFSIFNST